VDPLSPIVEYEQATVLRSPSPLPPPLLVQEATVLRSPSPLPTPLLVQEADDQKELEAQEEIQRDFRWLVDILNQNQRRGWGTAYRDFVDVLMLLRAASTLGMVELGNNRVSDGVFSASTGDFTLSLATFIDIMDLVYTPATWRNKLTFYFRLKSLYQYSQHADGIAFQNPAHNSAWSIVSRWVEHQDTVLEESWTTKRFGNTELRTLVRDMLQEACKGKYILSLAACFAILNPVISQKGGMQYAEEFD
jgi:hypothetical protein